MIIQVQDTKRDIGLVESGKMNKLINEIIKPILEANSDIKKVVGIFGGRFQPFGPHHKKVYEWLSKQFDDAYITTSNIKKLPRHPMNFKEKVRHMTKMGIPKSKIIVEKSPFVAKNLEKKFNPKTTAFVYIFGKKDTGRLGGGKYFQDYKKNKNNLKGYKEHGYYLVAPHMSVSAGGLEVSGTAMRELLGSEKYKENREKLFKKMFGYYDKGVFNMMTNKFSKIFENVVTWDNTKVKKLKKKFKDNKGKELLHDISFKKALKKLKIPTKLLNNKNALVKYLTSNPQMMSQLLRLATEGVDLPIEIGDTVRMGKFKNKKVVVKSIDWNEKGDLLINGRPALKFRLEKKDDVEEIAMGYPDKEDMKKIKKRVSKVRNKSDSSKEYQYHPIDEFLINTDINKIIKEISNAGADGVQGVDSGPSLMFKNSKPYKSRGHREAEKLGWSVINYILTGDTDNLPPDEFELLDGWPMGPHNSVSYLPAGIGTGVTPNNQENLTGRKGYNKWLRNIRSVAQEVGFELIKFTKQEKDVAKQISKDTTDTLKKQKEEEKEQGKEIKNVKVEENVFTKNWWNDIINEVSAKTKKFKQKLMRRGIKIRYDKTKAQQDLQQKYGGQGEVVGKKFGLRKAYYAVPKKGFKKDTKPTITITKKEMDKLHTDKKIEKGNLRVLYKEGLLMEGGAYGHMAHPFDDKDLTFGDLKKIIESGLGGTLSREDGVTEKLDGQNIMISWKDGKLIAARNKGHIKNGGKTALDTKGIISKFKGRGDIKDAFVFAMKDLEKAIKSLSDKQKEKIFNNGYNFMNLEVMWPKSENVINYDKAELVFHGALIYDDKGNVKGEVKGSGRVLAGMIKQRNQNIQKKYKIGKPVFLDVPKHQDFGTMKSKFIGELNKLRNQYGLKDNDTLGLYHQSYWEEYIYNAAQQYGYDITDDILENLTKRWAFFDKSYKIPTIKKDLKDESEFLDWVLKTDKENHTKMVKENMKPFETLFFEVGAEILKNVKGFMAANPKKSVQNIRKKLNTSIENVKASGDKKKLNTLKLQLDKLNKIGGVDAIVPSEGIVFKYKGKTYKFTGAFAPINQITGLIYF